MSQKMSSEHPASPLPYVLGGQTGTQSTQQWGMEGDMAAQGVYDGDSKTDLCVFRPSNSTWYVLKSTLIRSGDKRW